MTQTPDPQLLQAEAELDRAYHDQGVQLAMGFAGLIGFLMTLLGWLGLRKQRNEVRAELARQHAIDVESVEPSPAAEDDGKVWPIACDGCHVVGACVCPPPEALTVDNSDHA